MNTKKNIKRVNSYVFLLSAYLGVVLGALFLMGADVPPEEAKDPREELAEDIVEAIEKVAEKNDEEAFEASPEPGEEKNGKSAEPSPLAVELPELDPEGGQGATILLLEIHDTIDMGLAAFVERSIERNQDVAAIIFDINTPGGRVDAATRIRDAIMALPQTVRSVAFIHPRAISAGAFISFACDFIFIADGGSIGAATPISIDGGEANAVGEKYVSYFRAEMASTARAKGRNGKIAEAMVDADVEIDGVIVKGKLLTLDTNGALVNKIANDRANSLKEVKKKIALPRSATRSLQMNWAEKLARILTDPILTGILMSVGMLGILMELYQPGFGLPGIVGITALLIFFAGHLVVHMAGMEEVLLFAAGIVLLVLEIFFIPGFGALGALGVVAIVASLVLSLSGLPIDISWDAGILTSALSRVVLSIFISLVLMVVAIVYLPRQKIVKNRLVLDAAVTSDSSGGVEGEVVKDVIDVGVIGVTESYLRPAGIARFDGHRIDVVSEGDFIAKGEPVEVVRTEGNRVVVRKSEEEA